MTRRPTAFQPSGPQSQPSDANFIFNEIGEPTESARTHGVSPNRVLAHGDIVSGAGVHFLWPYLVAVVAVVLLVTGLLKLHLLLTDPFADLKIGYSRFWLWGAVMAELGVVAFVMWHRIATRQWWTLMALFSVLLMVASWNVWSGREDCGCAGAISISPMIFWLFDLGVLASLVALRPPGALAPTFRFGNVSGATWGMVLGGVLAVAAFLAYQADVIPDPMASWLGRPPLANVRIHLGQLTGLDSFDHPILLSNPTDRDIRIVGVAKSCTCVVLEQSPLPTIPRRGQTEITINVRPTKGGPFHQRVMLYVDSPQQYSVAVDLVGSFLEMEK